MKKSSKLAQNYLYNLVYQFLAIIVPLITTPYVSRILEADGLGAYSFTYATAMYFCIFGKLGLDTYGQLVVAENRNDPDKLSQSFYGVFFARFLTTVVTSAFYVILILTSEKYKLLYSILSVCLAAQILDISWFFQGVEEFRQIMIRNCLVKLVCLGFIFALVKQKSDLYLYVLIMQGGMLLGNAVLWIGIKNKLHPCRWKELKIFSHLRKSLIYFIPTIATSMYTILDKSWIGWLTGSEAENGYYEQAHKVEQISITVITSLSTVTLPRLKYMFTNGDRKDAKAIIATTVRLVLLFSLPMMTGLYVMAPGIIPWFLGEGYDKSIGLLQVFSVLMLVVGLDNIIGKQCLMATGRQKQYNIGVIAGAVTNVVLNTLLIPHLLSYGAAIASVASECVVLVLFAIYSRDYLSVSQYTGPFLRYTFSALMMALCIYFIGRVAPAGTVGILIQLLSGVTVYFLLLLAMRDDLVKDTLSNLQKKASNLLKK